MKWRRVLRLTLAAVGLGTAVALVVFTRDRPEPVRPTISAPTDPDATASSGAGTDQRFSGGDGTSKISYQGWRTYPDGRLAWDKVVVTLKDGATLVADLMETKGRPSTEGSSEVVLTGNVRFQSPEGAIFQGQAGTYNNGTGLAQLEGPVKFSRGRLSGTGTGATYDRDTGVFRILADPVVNTAPDEKGSGEIKATSTSMTFMSTGRSMLFDGTARLARAGETLSADRATLYLAEDSEAFRVIELRGNSRVVPAPNSTSGMPDMRAANIDLGFYATTQLFERAILSGAAGVVLVSGGGRRSIDGDEIVINAASDGKTLTRLESRGHVVVRTPAATGAPARTIRSATFTATGNEKAGLTAAVFTGGVEFIETPAAGNGRSASPRTGTAESLTLAIRGELDAIDEANFQTGVRFKNGNVVGDADLGRYLAAKGVLELRPHSQRPKLTPHVTDGSVTVDAAEIIIVDLNTNDIVARRDVKTVREPQGNGAARDSALFDSRERLFGFGSEFHYASAAKNARYLGAPARLQQEKGDTMVSGREIAIVNDGDELTATGQTESVFVLEGEQGARGRGGVADRYRVTADSMRYAETSRAATYLGKPATLTSPRGETRADRIILTLQRDTRQLETLDATGNMRATMEGDRQAVGDALRYEAGPQRYTLRGKPITLRTKEKDGTCRESKGAVVHFDQINEVPEWRAQENPGGTKNADVSCSAPLNP